MNLYPSKIISGGQTGADKGGLLGAQDCGIETGGYAPSGYTTERGADEELRTMGLIAIRSTIYSVRTEANVLAGDGTVIFGDIDSPGSRQTLTLCQRHNKPHIINPDPMDLWAWVQLRKIETLNIAGNRESKNLGIQARVRNIVIQAFKVYDQNG